MGSLSILSSLHRGYQVIFVLLFLPPPDKVCHEITCIIPSPEICLGISLTFTIHRQSLSKLGDIFINDSFETCHTTHSSVVGIDLPVKAAGFQLMKELHFFHTFLYQPRRPFLAILGGSLLSDKIVLIDHLLDLADDIIITGGRRLVYLRALSSSSASDTSTVKACGGPPPASPLFLMCKIYQVVCRANTRLRGSDCYLSGP